MLRGDIADIRAADGNADAAYIPEGGDELGDCGFAAAGRPDERVDGSLAEGEIHAVQHFGFPIAEMNVAQFHGAALNRLRIRFRAGQFRRGQNVRHLPDDGADLGEIVGELHAADDRRDQPHGKEYDQHEFFRRQSAVFHQKPAMGRTVSSVAGMMFMANVK